MLTGSDSIVFDSRLMIGTTFFLVYIARINIGGFGSFRRNAWGKRNLRQGSRDFSFSFYRFHMSRRLSRIEQFKRPVQRNA